jgi:metal-responsive CopG/Arc/MetJ family transcriptional regulator
LSQTRVGISIDTDLNERWNKVSKKIRISKSGMISDFLTEVLPILEHEAPRDVMAHALEHIGKGISDSGSLFYEDKN